MKNIFHDLSNDTYLATVNVSIFLYRSDQTYKIWKDSRSFTVIFIRW